MLAQGGLIIVNERLRAFNKTFQSNVFSKVVSPLPELPECVASIFPIAEQSSQTGILSLRR